MKQVWIRFCDEGKSDSGKTSRFSVRAKDGGALLGEVRWFGALLGVAVELIERELPKEKL